MTEHRRKYDKEAVKKVIMEQYPDKDVIAALEKTDYDLEKFFRSKANDVIDDDVFYDIILLEFKDSLWDYFIDHINGYWEIPETSLGIAGFYRKVFLDCHTDEDIWELLYRYCPTKTACEIYKCYMGTTATLMNIPICLKDPDKARRMQEYFAHKTTY